MSIVDDKGLCEQFKDWVLHMGGMLLNHRQKEVSTASYPTAISPIKFILSDILEVTYSHVCRCTGCGCIHLAAQNNQIEILDAALRAKADVNLIIPPEGGRPFLTVASLGSRVIVSVTRICLY